MEKTQPIRVVIVDDSPNMRMGLRRFLEQEPDIEVVGDASDTAEAMKLVHHLTPDIVTTDLNRGFADSGFELLHQLNALATRVGLIVLTAAITPGQIVDALRLGAQGIVLKSGATKVLLDAIRRVAAGGYWINCEPVSDLAEYMRTLVRDIPPGSRA